MSVECDWFTFLEHQRIALRDDARGMALNRANACIALSGDCNAMHKRETGSRNNLASMTG